VIIKQYIELWEVEIQILRIITLALNENGQLHASALFSPAVNRQKTGNPDLVKM
jgi:hypothetical protein